MAISKDNHYDFYTSKADRLLEQWELLEKADGKIPPTLRLPIDDNIDALRQRTHPPCLADSWRNPRNCKIIPSLVRKSILRAFDHVARTDWIKIQNQRDSDLEFLKDAQRVEREVTEFLRRHGNEFGLASIDLLKKVADVFLGEVGEVADLAKQALDETKSAHTEMHLWKYDFVADMAKLWQELTGTKPSPKPDGLFIEFVDAAWRSGGDDMPSESWEWTVRKRLSKRG
jgi:hypothetical protein